MSQEEKQHKASVEGQRVRHREILESIVTLLLLPKEIQDRVLLGCCLGLAIKAGELILAGQPKKMAEISREVARAKDKKEIKLPIDPHIEEFISSTLSYQGIDFVSDHWKISPKEIPAEHQVTFPVKSIETLARWLRISLPQQKLILLSIFPLRQLPTLPKDAPDPGLLHRHSGHTMSIVGTAKKYYYYDITISEKFQVFKRDIGGTQIFRKIAEQIFTSYELIGYKKIAADGLLLNISIAKLPEKPDAKLFLTDIQPDSTSSLLPSLYSGYDATDPEDAAILGQALWKSVICGDLDTCRFLLQDMHVDVNSRDCIGSTLLHESYPEIIDLVLAAHPNIDAINNLGETPLMSMVTTGDEGIKMTRTLLGAGANPFLTLNGKNAFTVAIDRNNTDAAVEFITYRSPPLGLQINDEVMRLLHPVFLDAVSHGDENRVKNLHHAIPKMIHWRDDEGNSALHIAAMSETTKPIVDYLLKEGADLLLENKSGKAPFEMEVFGHADSIKKYLHTQAEAQLNDKINDAIKGGDLNKVFYYLRLAKTKGFKSTLNAADDTGDTLLILTAKSAAAKMSKKQPFDQEIAAVQQLLALGADPYIRNKKRQSYDFFIIDIFRTYLGQESGMAKAIDMIRLFPQIDFDMNDFITSYLMAFGTEEQYDALSGIRNMFVYIPIGKKDAVEDMKRSKIETRDKALLANAFYYAANKNPQMCAQMRDDFTGVIDLPDSHGDTALHRAASEGNIALFKELLQFGANPAVLDGQGRSPAERAPKKLSNAFARLAAKPSQSSMPGLSAPSSSAASLGITGPPTFFGGKPKFDSLSGKVETKTAEGKSRPIRQQAPPESGGKPR